MFVRGKGPGGGGETGSESLEATAFPLNNSYARQFLIYSGELEPLWELNNPITFFCLRSKAKPKSFENQSSIN